MSDNPKTAFVRGFLFPVVAAILIVVAFKTFRPERFESRKILQQKAPQDDAELPVFEEIPDFSLIQANGEKFTKADLQGKVWIADFIFTRCSGICPLMSGRMGSLTHSLKEESNIRFVSFSVDPENDTPEILTQYAKRFSAPTGRWFFLTGDKAQIFKLSNQHFHLGVADVDPKEREALDQSVRHSAKFVLIDRKGQIRGYYDSDAQADHTKLIQDARGLL